MFRIVGVKSFIFLFFVSTDQESHDPTATLEDEVVKNQTKAVLLTELVSMELFYGLDDLLRLGPTGIAQGVTSSKLYSLTDKDLLLHSAETLLEVYLSNVPKASANNL